MRKKKFSSLLNGEKVDTQKRIGDWLILFLGFLVFLMMFFDFLVFYNFFDFLVNFIYQSLVDPVGGVGVHVVAGVWSAVDH